MASLARLPSPIYGGPRRSPGSRPACARALDAAASVLAQQAVWSALNASDPAECYEAGDEVARHTSLSLSHANGTTRVHALQQQVQVQQQHLSHQQPVACTHQQQQLQPASYSHAPSQDNTEELQRLEQQSRHAQAQTVAAVASSSAPGASSTSSQRRRRTPLPLHAVAVVHANSHALQHTVEPSSWHAAVVDHSTPPVVSEVTSAGLPLHSTASTQDRQRQASSTAGTLIGPSAARSQAKVQKRQQKQPKVAAAGQQPSLAGPSGMADQPASAKGSAAKAKPTWRQRRDAGPSWHMKWKRQKKRAEAEAAAAAAAAAAGGAAGVADATGTAAVALVAAAAKSATAAAAPKAAASKAGASKAAAPKTVAPRAAAGKASSNAATAQAGDEPSAAAQRYLTTLITSARSWQELATTFTQHRTAMNHIHTSAMLMQLARLSSQAGSTPVTGALARLLEDAEEEQQDAVVQQHVMRLSSRQGLHSSAGGAGALLHAQQQHEEAALPQGLHEGSYGLQAGSIDQESAGSMGVDGSSSSSSSSAATKRAQRTGATPLPRPTAEVISAAARRFPTPQRLAQAVAKEALAKVDAMGMWELVCALRAQLALGCMADKPTVIKYMTRAHHVMADSTAMGLANLIWAVAASGMRGLRADWAARFYGAVSQRCSQLSAQGVAVVLHSAATLQAMPPAEVRHQMLEHLVALAEGGRCWAPDVAMTLWSLAKLRTQPPQQLAERLLLATQHQLPSFTAQELAMTLWGLAKLRVCVPAAWCEAFTAAATDTMLLEKAPSLRSSRESASQEADARSGPAGAPLHNTGSSNSSSRSLGGSSHRRSGGSARNVAAAAPSRAAGTTEPSGTIGDKRCAKALSMTLYSMALLQLRPKEQWLASCLQYTARHGSSFTQQGLTCVVYAVALMGYRPGKAWLVRCHRVLTSTSELHPASQTMLRKAYALLDFSPVDGMASLPAGSSSRKSEPAGGAGGVAGMRQRELGILPSSRSMARSSGGSASSVSSAGDTGSSGQEGPLVAGSTNAVNGVGGGKSRQEHQQEHQQRIELMQEVASAMQVPQELATGVPSVHGTLR